MNLHLVYMLSKQHVDRTSIISLLFCFVLSAYKEEYVVLCTVWCACVCVCGGGGGGGPESSIYIVEVECDTGGYTYFLLLLLPE